MARIVERLIVAVGAQVDRPAMRAGLSAYSALSGAAFAAGAAVATFSIQQAAAIDEAAKAARSLALTTEEYTQLMFAADRSGASVEDMTGALNGLQSQIKAASDGSEDMAGMFRAMGIDIRDANGELRTSADVLPDLADGLSALPDGRRQAFTLALLGESGARLATLLGEGSEGIARLTDRAQELGIALDEDTAAAGERLTDSVTDMKAAVSGMALQIASETMPAVADFVDGITDLLVQSDGFVRVGLDRAVRAVGFAMDFASSPAGKWVAALAAGGLAVGGIRGAGGLVSGLARLSPALGGAASAMGSGVLAAAPYFAALAAGVLIIDDIRVAAQGGDSAILRLADSMGVGEEAAVTFAAGGDLVGSAWGALPGLFEGVKLSVAGLIEDIREALASIGLDIPALTSLAEAVQGGLSGYISTVGENFTSAAEGFDKLTRYMAGDTSVTMNDGFGGSTEPRVMDMMDVVGAAGSGVASAFASVTRRQATADSVAEFRRMIAEEGAGSGIVTGSGTVSAEMAEFRRLAAQDPGSGIVTGGGTITAPVNVTVTTQDRRDAARAAGAEVERQVYQATAALDAM